TKILAEPKVITLSGRSAQFLSGGQVAVPAVKDGQRIVEMHDVGTELYMLPIAKSNGQGYLEVQMPFRAVNKAGGTTTSVGFVPGFDECSMRTSVELPSGHTMLVFWPGAENEKARLALLTPTIMPFANCCAEVSPARREPAPSVPSGLPNIARQLGAEYHRAAAAGDQEVATKLARMA